MVGTQDAPDVTQLVFMQVFREIDQFTGLSRFEAWLYRVSVNEALQHLRKRSRRESQALTQKPMSDQRPEHERGEAKELLDQALDRIEPELRSIFVLREVEGLSYGEIAMATEIPEGTVGSRLNRARPAGRTRSVWLGNSRILALAATVLVALGLGWFGYDTWFGHGDRHGLVAEFGHYLDEFRRDPEAAQKMLVARYDGESVSAEQAIRLVGY